MSNVLVAYFSATGTTGAVAKKLAAAIGADTYEIVAAEPYTNADLDWRNKSSRSSVEMKDESSRPAIGGIALTNLDAYDVIFLGAPIWWYRLPTILNTFMESYDFSGKKVVLFATSGGSGLGGSKMKLEPSASGATLVDGAILNGSKSDDDLKAFAAQYI